VRTAHTLSGIAVSLYAWMSIAWLWAPSATFSSTSACSTAADFCVSAPSFLPMAALARGCRPAARPIAAGPGRPRGWAPPATVVPGDGLRTPRTELGNLKSEFAEAPGGRAKQPDCGRRGASPCTPTPDAPARLLAGRGTATRTHRVPARSRRTAAGSRCR